MQETEPIDYDRQLHSLQEIQRYLNIYIEAYRVMAREHPRLRPLIPQPYIIGDLKFQGFVRNSYATAYPVKECVLVCLARKRYSDDIVPYYVSRRHNLIQNTFGTTSYKPGRFIFKPPTDGLPNIALAEEPAKAYTSPDYNIELDYIRLRRDNAPAQTYASDPLCALIPRGSHLNQHERLCVAVLSSSYFEGRERYARKPNFTEACSYQEVSFQTDEAKRLAIENHYEWMIRCQATVTENVYFISRACNSYHVFVYSMNSLNGKVYLENQSTNVHIADVSNRQHLRRRMT